jgi:hypothetical protein
MKRQDILEIIVNNPKAVFKNANYEAGKYSEYPTYFQVIGMTDDKSYVRVKEVSARAHYYQLNEDGSTKRDENNSPMMDERPFAERVFLKTESPRSMPTRLVLKSDRTEESMVADLITKTEEEEARTAEREARDLRFSATRDSFANALVCAGVLPDDDKVGSAWGREVNVYFTEEAMTRMISILKSALVEVEV